MKKIIIFTFLVLCFFSCDDKKEHVERINQILNTNFEYKDPRIEIEQSQDFSSLITSITINITQAEKQRILKDNKHLLRYHETKVDSFSLKVYSYDLEYEKIRESISVIKDSNTLNYTIYEN